MYIYIHKYVYIYTCIWCCTVRLSAKERHASGTQALTRHKCVAALQCVAVCCSARCSDFVERAPSLCISFSHQALVREFHTRALTRTCTHTNTHTHTHTQKHKHTHTHTRTLTHEDMQGRHPPGSLFFLVNTICAVKWHALE